MATVTDVCNEALALIGQEPIPSMFAGTIPANMCRTFFEPLRDALLRSHYWNFAVRRLELSPDAGSESSSGMVFTLPGDCLRVLGVGGPVPPGSYRVEGRKLYAAWSPVQLEYIARVENPAEWDPLFYQGMALHLAAKLALSLARNERKAQMLLTTAEQLWMHVAMSVDGQESQAAPSPITTLMAW